jgi:very-short-patch-repair endonuclease
MRRTPLPRQLADRPFSTRQAAGLGVAPDRLRARDLLTPHRGSRSTRPPDSLYERCLDLRPLFRPDVFVAHLTALELWGLPVPRRLAGGELHVASSSSRQMRRPGVVSHRYPSTVAQMPFFELPTAHPVEAWIECASVLALDEAIGVGDALAGRWSPWPPASMVEIEHLSRAVDTAARRPGASRLREAIELVRPGVDSPQETDLRLLIVRAGLPEPEVNVKRYTADGSYLGKPDLSYGWCRLALEYQGDHHRTDLETWRYDVARRERFEDEGWRVVLVSRDDLRGPAADVLTARIRRYLACRESR